LTNPGLAMYFMNTDMHMVTFTITMFEIVMLVFQVIYFLQRPEDKSRMQYLILLVCLIAYNVCSGFFTDPRIPIPTTIQTILAYLVGFTMSMYVVYYFYKVFDLKHLRFFATYGLVFFLFLPFVFLFVVPFLLTGDVRLSGKLTVIIPFFYGLGFIYSTTRALLKKFKAHKEEGKPLDDALYEHAIVAYISMLCWASLPVIIFFGDFQILEHSVTNAGFLMMTIIYVRSAIKQSRKEYERLLDSERNLQKLNQNLKKKVRKRTKKLEQVMEARRTTFINLAHETKTPLTLINNYLADYIEKNGEAEEINIVKRNLKRLTKDIVNFFDVESYEQGFSIYNHDKVVDVTKLLNTKAPVLESFAKRNGITLKMEISEAVFVKAHPGAIDRIVNNLVENAFKYSGINGEVCVTLKSGGNTIAFSVSDNGAGIPLEMQGKIFDPYYKLSIGGRNSEGMGMGLSIVKKLVEDLGGKIDLVSSPGNGTHIMVLLPVPSGHGEVCSDVKQDDIDFAHNQIVLEESLNDNSKPTILIVEDNIEMLNFIVNKLKSRYNVCFALNGKQALDKLQRISVLDLIVSDVMMNDMDGFEFCRALSETEAYSHIPFVFLTAKSTINDRLNGLKLGAVDYIQKPFTVDELTAKIESILGTLRKHRTAVVSKAYHTLMADSGIPRQTTVTAKRCVFTDNCKKYHLTSREVEIIKLLIRGLPYKIIGAELEISEKTVNKHISNIFGKAAVSNKIELIAKLEAQELLKDTQ
jgi:signal transduction histidine kinase/DNA-binding NarL/FixJ family response regulator